METVYKCILRTCSTLNPPSTRESNLSDSEHDWIAKYRAALDSEQGRLSSASRFITAIRRVWQSLVPWISSQAADSSVPPSETGRPLAKKVSQREVSPAQEERDTKAS